MGIVPESWGRGKGLVTTSHRDTRRDRGWTEGQGGRRNLPREAGREPCAVVVEGARPPLDAGDRGELPIGVVGIRRGDGPAPKTRRRLRAVQGNSTTLSVRCAEYQRKST